MGTKIHGIASSQAIDSSGEVVNIEGLDISSLEFDGTLTWAHRKDQPAQTVGKILKAKKIFSEQDCEDKDQLYFWNKCNLPFLYIIGELFDSQDHSGAKDIVSMLKYSSENKNLNDVLGMSIEGGKIQQKGYLITHSVARKVTLDPYPCNKTCQVKIKIPQKENNEFDDFFKSESNIAVEIFTEEKEQILNKSNGIDTSGGSGSNALSGTGPSSAGGLLMSERHLKLVPNDPKVKQPPTVDNKKFGIKTKSGIDVFTHSRPHEYKGATAEDHHEMSTIHDNASKEAKDAKSAKHHMIMSQSHRDTAIRMKQRTKLNKALDVGSGLAAPSELTQGAALSKENLDKKMSKKEKSKWLKRAEEEYNNWEKREYFQEFMSKKMPNLTKTEIDSIGKTMILNKFLKIEESLKKITDYQEE